MAFPSACSRQALSSQAAERSTTETRPAASRAAALMHSAAAENELSVSYEAHAKASHLAYATLPDGEAMEIGASGSGCRLFLWLLGHFRCRLYVGADRRRCMRPEHLFKVHPSPVVALLQEPLLLHKPQRLAHRPSGNLYEVEGPQSQAACLCSPQNLQGLAESDSSHSTGHLSSQERLLKDPCSSKGGGTAGCACEEMEGLRGAAWISSARDSREDAKLLGGSCQIDNFAFPFAFAVDASGMCDIFPLPLEPQQQQQQEQQEQQQQQQQQQQGREADDQPPPLGCLRLSVHTAPPGALLALRKFLEGPPAEPSCCSVLEPGDPTGDLLLNVTEAAVRELFFFLWGPADACMAADAAACDFAQWRLSFDFCSNCSKRRFVVYDHPLDMLPSSSSSSSNSNGDFDTKEDVARLLAVSAVCTCSSLRCCCIRVPACALEAVARDELRLPPSLSPDGGTSSKVGRPERLLRCTEQHGDSEPSSEESSWLSELPSSPSSTSPCESPRQCPAAAAATEGCEGLPAASEAPQCAGERDSKRDCLCGNNTANDDACSSPPDLRLSAAASNAAIASLQRCIAACLPKVGGRATPLLNNSTLDDASWIVSGARNVSTAQVTSQAASARSILAFACTEPWEVLLLLHASAATARALSHPLQDCADVYPRPASGSRETKAVRRLAARPGIYRQFAVQREDLQQQETEASSREDACVPLPLWLTLVEARELQKGREFRVFAAGGFPVGISQLWLAECIPELVTSSSLRKKTKRAAWQFLLQSLSRQALPPLFVADVYIHCNADGTDSCRLLRLNPWGLKTDPLLFTYEHLRALVLESCCWESELCEACSSPHSPEARRLQRCGCWERCELRYVRGTDEEVHDTQRALVMPQDLLEIAKGGGTSNIEEMLLDLKSAHADVIRKQKRTM